MATKTKTADAKKALVTEYVELWASKLNLMADEEDVKDISKKTLLDLSSSVSKMRRLADYSTFDNIVIAARPVAVTVLPEKQTNGGVLPTGFGQTVRANGITDAQFPLYIKLAKEKLGLDLMAEGNEAMLTRVKAMSKAQATKEISNMIKLPRIAQKAATPLVAVPAAPAASAASAPAALPAGIYAIEHDGEVKCYLVDYGRVGTQWDGFLFLSRISSDDKYAIRNRDEKARILAAITDMGFEKSGILAGHTLRQCRKCHRTLSDTKNPYFDEAMGPKCGAGGMD